FQAEDGIRDKLVTGVQTCALPIFMCEALHARARYKARQNRPLSNRKNRKRHNGPRTPQPGQRLPRVHASRQTAVRAKNARLLERSEERRVGKECRARGATSQSKKK